MSATIFEPVIELSSLDGVTGVTFEGDVDTGSSVSGAGDVNGDGLADVVFGTGRDYPAERAYLIFGRQGSWPASIELKPSILNGTTGVILNGRTSFPNDPATTSTGFQVASAGDVNDDGFDDLLVGSPSANSGRGQTYLLWGRPAWPASLDLTALTANDGVTINGRHVNEQGQDDDGTSGGSGKSVAPAGDVNGDGIDDFLIGAPDSNFLDSSAGAGQAHLIFGHQGIWPDTLDLGGLNGINGVTFNGISSTNGGAGHVVSAGDVNGDGLWDVVITAPFVNIHSFRDGQIYIIFGHPGNWPAIIELPALDGHNGVTLNGVLDCWSGWSVSVGRSVGGGNVSDILIGAPFCVSGGHIGRAQLVFGHVGDWPAVIELSS